MHGDFRPSPSNWSRAVSSAFRTADGLTFVTNGLPEGLAGSTGPIEAYVLAPSGETLWSHRFSGQVRSVYRGSPPEIRPASQWGLTAPLARAEAWPAVPIHYRDDWISLPEVAPKSEWSVRLRASSGAGGSRRIHTNGLGYRLSRAD